MDYIRCRMWAPPVVMAAGRYPFRDRRFRHRIFFIEIPPRSNGSQAEDCQEFLTGVPDDRNDTVIERATIDLVNDMELTVIAEGAETAAQMEFLCALW